MATRRIALEFDSEVVVARALARALHALLDAADLSNASVTVDGFSMNPSDGWRGDYEITVKPR